MVVEFIAEEGTLKGLVLALEEGEQWKIGRDIDECKLILEDPQASRVHALVTNTPDGYTIENLSSTRPLLVNDEEITDKVLLHEGDRVKIGGTVFRFYTEGEKGA